MAKRFYLLIGLVLALAGCRSGPSSSAPDETEEVDRDQAVVRRAGFLEGLRSGRHTAARLMGDLTGALPDGVRLTEGVYESAEVRVKGRAPSNLRVADYITRLERSAVLTKAALEVSIQKRDRGGAYQEFALRGLVKDPGGEEPAASGSPAARLEELEKLLPTRQETAQMLREFQTLALEAGLQMTKFAPEDEIAGEFYAEWPVSIEVEASQAALGRYFSDLSASRRLWSVEKFSFKTLSPQDGRSPLRASIMLRTCLLQ